MMTALPAQHADTLEEAMVKPLRRILTRAVNKPLPGLPEGTQDASPGSPSPPISGCSDLSAPDRFFLRQQTAEAHTPSSKRASVPTALRMSHTESSAEPVPPTQTGTNRARSISPADLDAAAAMLELPSAYQGSSSGGGARGSNGGSSHNSDGGSAQAATAAAGSGAHQAAVPEGPYAPELHASIADASAESAAELLLAAGRLASVSSQHSHSDKPHTGSSITRAPPSYGMLPSGAAADPTTARATDRPGREYTPAAVAAAFIHPGAFDTAGGFPGAAEPFAPGFYYGHSTTGAPHHAGMYSISMANRPVGCSCLKPCKPHTPCQQCGSPHSPGHTWRAGPTGPGTLCNACGTRYSRSKQKQMAAAAAASFAAGATHGEMMFWSGSSGGSSAYTDSLAGSSGVGKSMKGSGSGKQGRAGKVASSRVVKGSGGSRSSKGGAGTPYGVLAALERRWGAQSSNAQGPSVSGSQSGGGEGKGLEEQASVSEEQQAWMLQWQQYEQHYSQYKGQGEGEAGRAAGQHPNQQQQGQHQQQQHWLAYSNWLPQQDEQQQQ